MLYLYNSIWFSKKFAITVIFFLCYWFFSSLSFEFSGLRVLSFFRNVWKKPVGTLVPSLVWRPIIIHVLFSLQVWWYCPSCWPFGWGSEASDWEVGGQGQGAFRGQRGWGEEDGRGPGLRLHQVRRPLEQPQPRVRLQLRQDAGRQGKHRRLHALRLH